jgi:protein transport protein SEC23
MSEGTIQVYCSKEVTINGALGHCYGLNKMKAFVSEKQIGKGKTHAWYLGSLDTNKTITIAYETKEA